MRKCYLDNIRWITVVLVVIYHVSFIFSAVIPKGMAIPPFKEVQYQDGIQYFLYPWFMVLLFVVSGICARTALDKYGIREFVKMRTRKLLVPSTIGLFVFQWILGYVNMSIAGAFDVMGDNVPMVALYPIMAISGTGALWFIQTLWIFSILLVLVRKFEKGKLFERTKNTSLVGLILLGIPLWIFAQIFNTPVVTVYRFGIYGFAFFVGYFILAHENVMEKIEKAWLPLVIIALASGVAYTFYYFGQEYAVDPVIDSPFSIAYAWIMVLAVFGFMKKFGNWNTKFTQWMGKQSFGLYVFHYLTIAAAALWICHYHNLSALPSYLITAVSGFAGSWILNGVISRIPMVRWCVLGIKRKEKHDVSR